MPTENHPPLQRYVAAVLAVAIALILTLLSGSLLKPTPTVLFFAAVTLSTWYGGLRPALLATVLSALAIEYFFIPPLHTLNIYFGDLLRLSVLVLLVLFFNSLMEAQKRSQAALRKNEKLLRLIADSLPTPICYIDESWRYRFNNQAYEKWFGIDRTAIEGKHLQEVWPESDYQNIRPHLAAVLSGKYITFEKRDNSVRYIDVTCVPDIGKQGEVRGCVVLMNDITKRKQAELALQEANDRLEKRVEERTAELTTINIALQREISERKQAEAQLQFQANVLSQVSDVVLAVDKNRRIIYWNQAAENLYQVTAKEAIGRLQQEVYEYRWIAPEAEKETWEALETQGYWAGELIHILRSGAEKWVEATVSVLKDERGNQNGYLAAIRDVTARKQAQEDRAQLIREQAARAEAEAGQQRLNLSAQTSRLLATCLDYETTLVDVGRLTVPYLADWCVIHTIAEDGSLRLVVMVHEDYSKQSLMAEILASYQFDPDRSHGYPKVIKTGESELICEITDDLLLTVAQNAEHLQQMRQLSLKSNLCVPLKARGQILGALSLATAESGRHFNAENLALAEDLAERIALAVDNARLYRQAQQALQQQAESLALIDALFTASPVAIGFLDRNLRYIRVNQKLADINGFSIEQHIGLRFRELLPKMADRFEAELQQVLDSGEPQLNIEFSGEAPGQPGRFGYWQSNRYPVRGKDGQILGIGIMIVDISDRKQAELALRTSEERYRAFIEQSSEGIWRFELEKPLAIDIPEDEQIEHFYRYAYLAECNDALARMYGYTVAQELIGVRLEGFLVRSDPHNLEYLLSFIRSGYRLSESESHEVDRYGNMKYFSNSFIGIIENGFLVRAWGNQRDISKRKRAESMLHFLAETSSIFATSLEYEETLQRVAQLPVPLLADWCSVEILQADKSIRRMPVACADRSKIEWAKKLEQYPPDANGSNPIARVMRSGISELIPEISDELLVRTTCDAEHLRVVRAMGMKSAAIVPLVAHERILGTITFVTAESNRRYTNADLAIAEDLGRRAALAIDNAILYREAQLQRQSAETANRIKDEFLAILSHELRTPLNPILGWAKLLRTHKLDETKTAYALETIERNAKLQTQLIEDLLDVSRILRGKLSLDISPVNLVSTIEAALEIMRLAAEAKAIEVRFSIDKDRQREREISFSASISNSPFLVLGDANRLQQIVWNLLSNAIKFTPSGGRVEIKLQQLRIEDLGLQIEQGKVKSEISNLKSPISYAQITVSDTGKGINPDFLPYVFDYFRQENSTTTRTFGGLGLGLAIVRHLVEIHGGFVKAESSGEGLGATFTVNLPLLEESKNN